MGPKYRVMFDFGIEGYSLQEGEYETVDAAVKAAMSLSYSTNFIIVQIIEWEAQCKTSIK